ncbi:hypothetical protein BGZ61DRAFT_482723 [Ilyonectria robusta]|uniref:uncharacterized protein n=1 Tax=Ilyonectria robusta TaxID=1079257 RepID=UPI001E8EA192|nr:uncharacterized protein BGZ61DRAFT_482723 [Ilyonectria robusta]KAH8672388.1 hypothetical protein BGZ61DRAFT_482723 [Ilyonectria robusta]
MDIFSSLPPELRLEIFLCLRTTSKIAPLIRASPTMFAQYQTSKKQIRLALLRHEFDDDSLQDAMAIVLFPLMHPTDTDFSVYMEDYITKATAIYPPRAYLALPDLSPRRGQSTFRNKSIGLETLKLDDLSDQERRRLLRAFLRYEFMCKVYHPRQGSFDKLDKPLRLREHFKFLIWEYEGVRCVRYYIQNLYGAIFAHHANSWLPNVPKVPFTQSFETVSESELLFPDNVLFCPDSYYDDLCLEQSNPNFTTRALARLGFDLITFILGLPRDEAGCSVHLKQWPCAFHKRYPSRFSVRGPPATIKIRRPTRKSWKQPPGLLRELFSRLRREDGRMVYRIYRQRAWVFLDDARHYPHQSTSFHFPTEKQLVENRERTLGIHSHDPLLATSQRRSQAWHDGNYTARIDENETGDCETFSFGDEDASRVLRFFEAFSSDESSIF